MKVKKRKTQHPVPNLDWPNNLGCRLFWTNNYKAFLKNIYISEERLEIALKMIEEEEEKAIRLYFKEGLSMDEVGYALRNNGGYGRYIINRALRSLRHPEIITIFTKFK